VPHSIKAKKEAAVILHLPQILTPQHGSNIPHAVLSFNQMNAAFSATHYFHYVVKRLYQKIYAQFPIKIILAQAYMKIKRRRKSM
jgi:hypothetical protein